MSHFTTIAVQFRDRELLKEVLQSLGHKVVENGQVRGYRGATTTADLVVQRPNGYDIGFRQVGDHLEMVADWWGTRLRPEEFLGPIRQAYAQQQLLRTAQAKGFTVESQTVDEQGRIRIVLGRWV